MDKNNYGKFLLQKIIEILNINDESIINIYIYLKSKDLLDISLADKLIELIISYPQFKGDNFIEYLKELFILHNSEESTVVKFINSNSNDYICTFFRENIHFARGLMQNFFVCVENSDFLLPVNEEKKEDNIEITSLPEILRGSINDVIDFFYNSGMELPSICMLLQLLFSPVMGKDAHLAGVHFSNKEVQDKIYTLLNYKPYLVRMILADVYADSLKNNTDGSFNNVLEYINECIKNGKYEIPEDLELIDDIFRIFMHANDDIVVLRETINSLTEEEKSTYLHINPLYPLEDIGKGRA